MLLENIQILQSEAWSSDVSKKDSPMKSMIFPPELMASSVLASSNFSMSCLYCAMSARISSNRLFRRPNSLIFSWSTRRTCRSRAVYDNEGVNQNETWDTLTSTSSACVLVVKLISFWDLDRSYSKNRYKWR